MKCQNYYVTLLKKTPGGLILVRPRCKMWNCEYCAKTNAGIWQSRLKYALNSTDGTWQFLTFTAHRKWRGSASSLKNIRANSGKLWKRYVRLVKKTTSHKMHYVRLFEPHKDDSVHVHAFIYAPMTIYPENNMELRDGRTSEDMNGIGWLKKASAECGMGWQCDVTEIQDKNKAVNYVVKYMTKEFWGLQLPKSARRIQTSQQFPQLPHFEREKDSDWELFLNGVRVEMLISAILRGDSVFDASINRELTLADLNIEDVYYDSLPETSTE